MQIEFLPMSSIDPAKYIQLHADPLVKRHMPLTGDDFDLETCKKWIAGKERMWQEHGFGPWAFVIDGKFAGWGGLQPEGEDADLGLVLHPSFWGTGKAIFEKIMFWASSQGRLPAITILLPPSRSRVKGILRLGFEPDGETEIDGERFIRFRLRAFPDNNPSIGSL